jgi:hypothetical protein
MKRYGERRIKRVLFHRRLFARKAGQINLVQLGNCLVCPAGALLD